MARVHLRPEDLELMARRFDALSEDLRRSARKLEGELEFAALNRHDVELPASRFGERTSEVAARLRRLAGEAETEAATLSAAAGGLDLGWDHRWLGTLQALVAGWDPLASLGSACSGVVRGLATVVGAAVEPFRAPVPAGSSAIDTGGTAHEVGLGRPVAAPAADGGLFVAVSSGGDDELIRLGRVLGDMGRSPSGRPGPGADPGWAAVWDRLNTGRNVEGGTTAGN